MHPIFKSTLVAGALAVAMVPQHASAVQILATVDYTLGSDPSVNDTDGPAGSGFVDVLNSGSNAGGSVFYHTYGNTSGNFGSRTSGNGLFDIAGEFNFDGSYLAGAGPVLFDFTVVPGEISTSLGGATIGAGELFARYELDILLNGTSIWDSSAQVVTNSGGTTFTYGGSTTISGPSSVTSLMGTESGSSYSWGTVNRSLDITSLVSAGSPFQLEYNLRTFAHSTVPGTDCFGGGEGEVRDGNGDELNGPIPVPAAVDDGGPGQGGSGCASTIARIGDPFSFGSNPPASHVNVVGAQTVPEPSILLLMGIGLAGLAARRRS